MEIRRREIVELARRVLMVAIAQVAFDEAHALRHVPPSRTRAPPNKRPLRDPCLWRTALRPLSVRSSQGHPGSQR
jgi:hypothetical protein